MNGHPPRAGAGRRADARRRRAAAPALFLAATLASAGALGMVLYVASTSLPFLASSPTTDPTFGRANECLINALPTPRVGFAIAWDGGEVAGYSGSALALCGPDGGATVLALRGIQQAAWDEKGTLWLATGEVPDAGFRLAYLAEDGGVSTAGDFAAMALAGHRRGVVALDATGKLVSVTREGQVLGWAQLPASPTGPVQLSVDADGDLATVVAGGGLFAYRTADLSRVLAEAPCEVEYLWWAPRGPAAVISCGPQASFALSLQLDTGARDAAPRREWVRSILVPGAGVYAQPCEQLPCTAPPP